jgi:hypothetical protein
MNEKGLLGSGKMFALESDRVKGRRSNQRLGRWAVRCGFSVPRAGRALGVTGEGTSAVLVNRRENGAHAQKEQAD